MTENGTISTTRAVERCERLAALGPPPAWWRVFALRRWLRGYRAIMALDIRASAEMLRQLYPAGHVHEMGVSMNDEGVDSVDGVTCSTTTAS